MVGPDITLHISLGVKHENSTKFLDKIAFHVDMRSTDILIKKDGWGIVWGYVDLHCCLLFTFVIFKV